MLRRAPVESYFERSWYPEGGAERPSPTSPVTSPLHDGIGCQIRIGLIRRNYLPVCLSFILSMTGAELPPIESLQIIQAFDVDRKMPNNQGKTKGHERWIYLLSEIFHNKAHEAEPRSLTRGAIAQNP